MTTRKVTIEDSTFLLNLKNERFVRKFSIASKEPILKENHEKWLQKTLKDKTIQFFIIEHEGKRAGDLRINGEEISIRICPWARKMGLGKLAIKKHRRISMKAKIVDGNIASMRLFLSTGFLPIGYKDGVYTFKCV